MIWDIDGAPLPSKVARDNPAGGEQQVRQDPLRQPFRLLGGLLFNRGQGYVDAPVADLSRSRLNVRVGGNDRFGRLTLTKDDSSRRHFSGRTRFNEAHSEHNRGM
jgi:hypothetical protein